jgi:large subunit ribosomal protein L22
VRIQGDRLSHAAAKAGVGVDALAEAVDRTGLSGDRARTAVRNWMAGRDHPRCKQADITRLARAIGCEPKDIARFTSQVCYARGATRKARLLADLVRGRGVVEAENLLTFTTKRAAVNMRKALVAARTEAEEHAADVERLVVAESRVEEGPHIKRFRPKDRGRAHPILKRSSHIVIGLEERTGARE